MDRLDPMTAPAGGRPTEERELRPQGRRTVRRLLDAGREAIADRGFPNVRVDDIASGAETSHGTFYLYFANKDDLLEALAREAGEAMSSVADRLPDITPDEVGRKSLRVWLDEFDDVHHLHGPVLRAWVAEHDGADARDEVFTALRRAFADRLRRRAVEGLEPDSAAAALVAMIERFTYLRDPDGDRASQLDTLALLTHRAAFA